MDDVVNPDGGKFRLGEPEHLLPPLVERDDAQVQLVLRLEHHLGGRVRIGRERIVHWVGKSHLVGEKGGVYLLLGHLQQAGGAKGGADAEEGKRGLLCFSVLTMQLLDLPSDV